MQENSGLLPARKGGQNAGMQGRKCASRRLPWTSSSPEEEDVRLSSLHRVTFPFISYNPKNTILCNRYDNRATPLVTHSIFQQSRDHSLCSTAPLPVTAHRLQCLSRATLSFSHEFSRRVSPDGATAVRPSLISPDL